MPLKWKITSSVLLPLSILLASGCNDAQVSEKTLVEKTEDKLAEQPIDKNNVNLFMADIDGIPWIIASITNNSSNLKKFHIDLVSIRSYIVRDKKTGEKLPYLGGMIKMPYKEGEGFIQVAPSTHVAIRSEMPPIDFDVEEPITKKILQKYTIHHELYGEVEPFTDEDE